MSSSPRTSPLARSSSLVLIFSLLPKLLVGLPTALLGPSPSAASEGPAVGNGPQEAITREEWWVSFILSAVLVLLGGVFAGLTIALMGQDEVNLKVVESSGERHERKYARNVLKLIGRSKHWVLVTLLLSNVITNETLPIILHKCTGGGVSAVISSTAAIVIFGEIIPQSICVRYGLQIGSFFCPFVLFLMYCLYPLAYPTALLLDKLLGEDHGTVYKKAGLKTLVTLHHTMGVERLNTDEVTMISSVLDLKEKRVDAIMTPIEDIFTLSSDTILDEEMIIKIFNTGFSRIPIHLPGEPLNFIGMLLVRILINYDPEDAVEVSNFPLATLPETPPETTCLNILNYFQEGKSHMVLVSKDPGSSTGAIGILTLEDVIEELIGEEIVDESDVFVDIHNAIKRKEPGPLSRKHLTQYFHALVNNSWRLSNKERESLLKSQHIPNGVAAAMNANANASNPNGVISTGASPNGTSDSLADPTTITTVNGTPVIHSDYGSISHVNRNLHPSQKLKNAQSNDIVVTNGEGEEVVVLKRPKNSMKPSNLASNPLNTTKSYVHIKRGQGASAGASTAATPAPEGC